MVFRILRKITMGPCLGNRLDDGRPIYSLEPLQLFLQALGTL
jgi:hypothetical protein